MKSFKTVAHSSKAEYTDRRSVFYGYAAPAATEEEALQFLANIRKIHSDATHNVYAYIIRGGISRFSDDGEPHGTAGLPVLDVLRKEDITDTIIVVTRYFGGTLLGTGGLVRAYTAAAKAAVDLAGIKTARACVRFRLACSYSDFQRLAKLFENYGVSRVSPEYLESIIVTACCPETDYPTFCTDVKDTTGGRSLPEEIDLIYD